MTFLCIPGAWAAVWTWNEVTAKLTELGHTSYSITLSGLSTNSDCSQVTLQTHVTDVISYIQKKKLTNLILVAHSYAGFVAIKVADLLPQVLNRLVLLESFLPTNGQSMLEAAQLDVDQETQTIAEHQGQWPAPTREELRQQGHLSDPQVDYLAKQLTPHPGKTVTEPLLIDHIPMKVPLTYISTSPPGLVSHNPLLPDIDYQPLDGGHWSLLTKPTELAQILARL